MQNKKFHSYFQEHHLHHLSSPLNHRQLSLNESHITVLLLLLLLDHCNLPNSQPTITVKPCRIVRPTLWRWNIKQGTTTKACQQHPILSLSKENVRILPVGTRESPWNSNYGFSIVARSLSIDRSKTRDFEIGCRHGCWLL